MPSDGVCRDMDHQYSLVSSRHAKERVWEICDYFQNAKTLLVTIFLHTTIPCNVSIFPHNLHNLDSLYTMVWLLGLTFLLHTNTRMYIYVCGLVHTLWIPNSRGGKSTWIYKIKRRVFMIETETNVHSHLQLFIIHNNALTTGI